MSEAEDRKAKAARAKALVRTPLRKLKLPPLTDLTSSRRGNRPPSRTRVPRHRGHSPRYRKTSLLRTHPHLKSMKPRTRQTCKSHLFESLTADETNPACPQSRFGQTSGADGTWLNSLSRVDDAPASPSTAGVSTQQSSQPTRLPHHEPPTDSPTHSLLQSLRVELQRHQDAAVSLRSERDALNKELDRRKDLENSESA